MTTTNHRWRTSIHEAAHGVASLVLGGECTQLTVHHAGGGMAFIDGLSPFDYVVAVAAASEAETMLADCPAPEREPSPDSFHVRDNIAELTPAEKLDFLAARFPENASPSDEQTIARYCIQGLEDQPPTRWAARYNGIHHVASRVVSDHRERILSVARELFARGVLSQTEIKEAMQCR